MTEEQIRTFCDKLIDYGLDIHRDVMQAVFSIKMGGLNAEEPDYFICFGNRLRKRLNEKCEQSTEKGKAG